MSGLPLNARSGTKAAVGLLLERTFQVAPGIGPWRERDLWARGLVSWSDFEAYARSGVVMAQRLDRLLLEGIALARAALATGDLPALMRLVPPREHWRLYPRFQQQAVFFDIEADGDHLPTIVGLLDDTGVASFRRGANLDDAPARLARSAVWVTFNGGAYDIPVLQRTFPGLAAPALHLDLRFLVVKAGLKGGLKSIEAQLGLERPQHLKGLAGLDAIRLWREFDGNGRRDALRLLAEYNLYDAVSLKGVLEHCEARLWARAGFDPGPRPAHGFERGDVLYDISRLVLDL